MCDLLYNTTCKLIRLSKSIYRIMLLIFLVHMCVCIPLYFRKFKNCYINFKIMKAVSCCERKTQREAEVEVSLL